MPVIQLDLVLDGVALAFKGQFQDEGQGLAADQPDDQAPLLDAAQ